MGHSRPGPAGRRSSHVRYALTATFGHQNAIGRDGPQADILRRSKIVPFVDHLVSLDFGHPHLGFNRVDLIELFRTGLSVVAPRNLWA
jgi:hypothetical protein